MKTRHPEQRAQPPAELGASKLSARRRRRMVTAEPRRPDEMQTPETIAAVVLEGIRANDAYILSHAHYRKGVQARSAELMGGFDRAPTRGPACAR